MPWTIEKLNNYGKDSGNGWTIDKLNNYGKPKGMGDFKALENKLPQPIIEETTPKKSGFLSSLAAPFSSENLSNANSDLVKFLQPKVQNWVKKDGGSAFAGAVNSIGLGLPKVLTEKLTGNKETAYSMAKEENPIAYGIGEVGGYLAPGVGATKALKPVTSALTKNVGSKLGKQLIEGALVGSALDTTQGAIEGDNAKQLATRVGTGALLGAGADIGLNALGKLAPKAIQGLQNINPSELLTTSKKVTQIGRPIEDVLNPPRLFNKEPINTDLNLPIKPQGSVKSNLGINTLPIQNEAIKRQETPLVRLKKERIEIPKVDLPMAERDFNNVGNKSIKSFQYQLPEFKPEIQGEAQILKGELERTLKSERGATTNNLGETVPYANNRVTSDSIASIKQLTGASYDKIDKAIDGILKDNGKENNALSKKIELFIDDRLSNGYTDDLMGADIPPNVDYILKKANIEDPLKYKTTTEFSGMKENKSPITKQPSQEVPLNNDITKVDINKFDNVEDLDNHIKQLESAFKNEVDPKRKGMIMDLQLFAKKKRESLSKFRSNTIERTTALTDEEKNILTPKEFDYIPQTSTEWAQEAEKRVSAGMENEINRIKNQTSLSGGADSHTAALISVKLRDEARQTGDYSKLIDWLKNVASKTRETARALKGTDTAWEKKSADGAIMDAARTVDNAEDAVKKSNPKLIDKVEKSTNEITKSLDNIDVQSADSLAKDMEKFTSDNKGKFNFLDMAQEAEKKQPTLEFKPQNKILSPAEKLANKIDDLTAPKQTEVELDKDEKTMLNTLLNIAKKELPKFEEKSNITPEELISEALKNKDQYANVWSEAKNILKDRFKFDDARIENLSGYLEKKLRPVFEESKLNKSISEELKSRGVNLSDIVKQHYSVNSKLRKDLIETLIEKTGLSGENAEYLSKFINNRMKELTKQKKEQVIKQIFKETPKAQQKNIRQKVEELINLGAYDNNTVRDLIKQKEGLPILEKSDINYISEHMEKAKSFPEGSIQQRGEISLVEKLISEKQPKNFGEKLKTFRKDMMLLNPVTLVTRNPGSNVLLGAAENIKDIPGTLIDKVIGGKTGLRTTGLPEYGVARKGNLEGAKRGLKEFAYDIKNNTDTSRSRGQMEIAKGDVFKNPILKAIDKTVNLGLQLGDRPFFEAAFEGRLNELKKINKVTEPTKDMIDDAMNIALDRVLQNSSGFSKFGGDLRRATNELKPGIGDIVLPFTQTPGNVLDKALDYSPLGLVRGGASAAKLKNFIGTNDIKGTKEFQKKAVDQLGRGLVGTGLLGGGVAAGNSGLLTGKGEKNKNLNEFNKTIGKQNYSAKIGDKYISYDWLQPLSTPLAAGVDYAKEKNFGKGLASGIDTVVKQSFLRGITNLFGTGSPATGFYNTMLEVPASFLPSVGGRIAKTADPIQRDVSSDSKLGEMINNIKAKTVLSKTLPAKIDTYGNEMKNFGGSTNLANNLLNPAYTSEYKPSKTDEMLLDVYSKTSNAEIFPKSVEDSITYTDKKGNQQTIKLTAEEKADLQKKLGQDVKSKLDQLASSYNGDAEKAADKMQTIKNKAWQLQRALLLKEKGIQP